MMTELRPSWIHVPVPYQTEILVFAHNLSSKDFVRVFPTGMQFLVCHLFIKGFWFVFYHKELFLDQVFFKDFWNFIDSFTQFKIHICMHVLSFGSSKEIWHFMTRYLICLYIFQLPCYCLWGNNPRFSRSPSACPV